MQIVVPMSGFGERFRRAGYEIPKPLIEVEGKPIIAHVVDMFPREHEFIFICNRDHLANGEYRMESILRQCCPSGRIVGIPPHKLGPIHAVRQVESMIDPERPVVVNYCDFTCYWNWHDFKKFVAATSCSGAIPAYKGFHPHSLGSTYYAYMQEANGWVQDIQEKQPYTNNRLNEFASSGTYYFASGKIMNDAFRVSMEREWHFDGEYYVSLAYKHLLGEDRSVAVYPIQHFMQWGTPEDVAEYSGWSSAFRRLVAARDAVSVPRGSMVIPMAGLGQRFVKAGYGAPKPTIPVSGQSMVVQAAHDLPAANNHVFVLRGDMPGYQDISNELKRTYPRAIIETIPGVTRGQACTALIGLEAIEREGLEAGPVTFGACDCGMLYDGEAFERLLENPEVDVIVWGGRGQAHAVRLANMSGWIDARNGRIEGISVKEPLASPATDPVVLGAFTFRRAADFRRAMASLVARDGRVRGEFYIDSCINDAIAMGLRCHLFEVDHVMCWGTPEELRTFEYWQSCFHKWAAHPYRLELDSRIPKSALRPMNDKYATSIPRMPLEYCSA
jgi:NDP-sugar pyrophosphorylase family protein